MSHETTGDVIFSVHSSFGKFYSFANMNYLMRLANNESFVISLMSKEPDESDSYMMLINTITDMLHDYFSLDSIRRRQVRHAQTSRTHSLRSIIAILEAYKGGRAFDPQRVDALRAG